MHIKLNQQTFEVPTHMTLADFLSTQQQDRDGVAVAINQQLIPRSLWLTQPLQANDHIQLFTAIAGG